MREKVLEQPDRNGTNAQRFPGAKQCSGTRAAKEGLREFVLTHQIYRPRLVGKRPGITRVELAKRMGVSQIRISQVESPELENFELGTLFRCGEALGGRVSMCVEFDAKQLESLKIAPDTLEVWGN